MDRRSHAAASPTAVALEQSGGGRRVADGRRKLHVAVRVVEDGVVAAQERVAEDEEVVDARREVHDAEEARGRARRRAL